MQLKKVSFPNECRKQALNNTFLILLLLFSTPFILLAQLKNEVDIPVNVHITPTANFNLVGADLKFSFVKGQGAEQIITPSTIGKMWINYSSVVEWNSTNSICISISSGNLPVEIILKLKVGPEAGFGVGKTGKSVGEIILNNYPQAIITEIGTCYTGQGLNRGHPLTFSWEFHPDQDSDILSIEEMNIQVGVTYTIINND